MEVRPNGGRIGRGSGSTIGIDTHQVCFLMEISTVRTLQECFSITRGIHRWKRHASSPAEVYSYENDGKFWKRCSMVTLLLVTAVTHPTHVFVLIGWLDYNSNHCRLMSRAGDLIGKPRFLVATEVDTDRTPPPRRI
ncbi:hypothetical protein PROFUN_02947 [Planoprotostelium fungivorum]|uniref:Uncharacterized protein n=1 Tax=Planoprotostelium fungivorum TaxID=1890364 RepID=A0A2P6NX75_9EUKA|nr:hypothetical protein PROFUN_02947 [Planoprotostelium fungivorum]